MSQVFQCQFSRCQTQPPCPPPLPPPILVPVPCRVVFVSLVFRSARVLFSSASGPLPCVSLSQGEPGSAARPRRNSVCSGKRLALKTRQWIQTHAEPGPPRPPLGLASTMVEWPGAKQLCPWMLHRTPDTVIPSLPPLQPPPSLCSRHHSPLRC